MFQLLRPPPSNELQVPEANLFKWVGPDRLLWLARLAVAHQETWLINNSMLHYHLLSSCSSQTAITIGHVLSVQPYMTGRSQWLLREDKIGRSLWTAFSHHWGRMGGLQWHIPTSGPALEIVRPNAKIFCTSRFIPLVRGNWKLQRWYMPTYMFEASNGTF